MNTRILSGLGAAAILAGVSFPATAQTAQTEVLSSETFVEPSSLDLPTPPVLPARYTLPMRIVVVKDASITTNTPLADQFKYGTTEDLQKWAEAVRGCLKDKPAMVRQVGNKQARFVVNKSEGKIKLNSNDRPVCAQ
jgi:hypothetical protein